MRKLARMEEQLRRLRERDWRPPGVRENSLTRSVASPNSASATWPSPRHGRDVTPPPKRTSVSPGARPKGAAAVIAKRTGDVEEPIPRRQDRSEQDDRLRSPRSFVSSVATLPGPSTRQGEPDVAAAGLGATAVLQAALAAAEAREQQLRHELLENQEHHASQLAALLKGREVELARRDAEIECLRRSELEVQMRAAKEMKTARLELQHMVSQQEALTQQVREAEERQQQNLEMQRHQLHLIQQRSQELAEREAALLKASAARQSRPVLELLGLSGSMSPEVKKARLREAVSALKDLVRHLSDDAEPSAAALTQLPSVAAPPPPPLRFGHQASPRRGSLPSIPEEISPDREKEPQLS